MSFAGMKNSPYALGQETNSDTDRGENYTHLVDEIFTMASFFAFLFVRVIKMSHLTAIDSLLLRVQFFSKCLAEDEEDA